MTRIPLHLATFCPQCACVSASSNQCECGNSLGLTALAEMLAKSTRAGEAGRASERGARESDLPVSPRDRFSSGEGKYPAAKKEGVSA
jgi:hypothetical protein